MKDILQVIADVFQLDVFVQSSTQNSAAMGAAYRAQYALLKENNPSYPSFNQIFSKTVTLELSAAPNKNRKEHYNEMVSAYKIVESKLKAES